MSRADLHVHSVYSDGLKTPEQLCALAGRLNITHLALCDHDTVDGLDAMAQAVRMENQARALRGQPLLMLIPCVEISTGPAGARTCWPMEPARETRGWQRFWPPSPRSAARVPCA